MKNDSCLPWFKYSILAILILLGGETIPDAYGGMIDSQEAGGEKGLQGNRNADVSSIVAVCDHDYTDLFGKTRGFPQRAGG